VAEKLTREEFRAYFFTRHAKVWEALVSIVKHSISTFNLQQTTFYV
jgi:hypothetical protein